MEIWKLIRFSSMMMMMMIENGNDDTAWGGNIIPSWYWLEVKYSASCTFQKYFILAAGFDVPVVIHWVKVILVRLVSQSFKFNFGFLFFSFAVQLELELKLHILQIFYIGGWVWCPSSNTLGQGDVSRLVFKSSEFNFEFLFFPFAVQLELEL